MRRRNTPQKPNIPSQRPSARIPYMPGGVQPDVAPFPALQAPHVHGYGGPAPVYVVSTYDARPNNAVDFQTQSGTNPDDTGFNPYPNGVPESDPIQYSESSIFYRVPPGRVAVARDYHLIIVPAQGEAVNVGGEGPPDYENPIFAPSGAGNFRIVIDFLVNGILQEGMSGIVSWAGAFGDIFGECYVIGEPGDVIELRIRANEGPPVGSTWYQAIMSLHGNLLLATGKQAQFEPGTDAIIPVKESSVTINEAGRG